MRTNDIPVVPEWTITDKLRKAREHANLTQKDLAVAIGVSKGTITRAENGNGITHRTLLQWAAATGVPVDWLSGGSTCACTTCTAAQAA